MEAIATGCRNDIVCIGGVEHPEWDLKEENPIGAWCRRGERRCCGFLIWEGKQ